MKVQNLRTFKTALYAANLRSAKSKWGDLLNPSSVEQLKKLSEFRFSVERGDLLLIDAKWYVTHTGLIGLATRRRCRGIEVQSIPEFSDVLHRRYAFKAIVFKSAHSPGFMGFGDADPSNVSSLVAGAEMRVAETRAVSRALRKAYGVGICSVEEIGSVEHSKTVEKAQRRPPEPTNGNRHAGSIRDRLYKVMRQHRLDPNLVKSYASEFCSVRELREATREQVETFVAHLADWAERDRPALLCQLNAYLSQKGNDGKEGAA